MLQLFVVFILFAIKSPNFNDIYKQLIEYRTYTIINQFHSKQHECRIY